MFGNFPFLTTLLFFLLFKGPVLFGQSVATPGSSGKEKTLQRDASNQGADLSNFDRSMLEATTASPFYGSFTVKVMNQYITRGIVVQADGVTIQPILDLNYHLYNFGGFFNDLSLITEFWNDISSNTKISAPPTSAPYWTETFLRAGFSLGFAKYFNLSSDFTQFLTPSDGYREGRYWKTILTCNDEGLLLPNFSLKPQCTMLYELPDSGQAGLRPNAWWFEPGVTPSYEFFSASQHPITLAFPFRIGLGNQFYAGTTYGYCSFGPEVTVPLTFISPTFGKWSLTTSYTYYNLGTTTAAIAPYGQHNQNLYTMAIRVAF